MNNFSNNFRLPKVQNILRVAVPLDLLIGLILQKSINKNSGQNKQEAGTKMTLPAELDRTSDALGIEENGEAAPKEGTPESDFEGGFHNYTAAEVFIQGLAGLVNQGDVETMIRAQKQMLQRFEKTNEMLLNCNALSQSRLKNANDDFKKHVKLLAEMKKDLDYIFRKVRTIKQKLNQQYPVAYAEAQPQRSSLAEEAEDETEASSSGVHNVTANSQSANTSLADGGEKKKSSTTVEYVQMEETIENGKPIENELIKRVCSIETANPNDSSDCTSEDTG